MGETRRHQRRRKQSGAKDLVQVGVHNAWECRGLARICAVNLGWSIEIAMLSDLVASAVTLILAHLECKNSCPCCTH